MYIALAAFFGIAFLVLLLSYITFRMIFLHGKNKKTDIYKGLDGEETERKKESRAAITRLNDAPFEKVAATSCDGKRLFGRFYHRNGDVFIIALHGYKSASVRDMARVSIEFENLGYSYLLADHRSHGESDGGKVTFGAKEKYDVLAWVDYICSRFENPKIFLYGISMGASTVLMASELIKDRQVFGIIADCPYSSPDSIIRHVTKNKNLPSSLLFPFIRLGGIIFGGFDVKKHSAVAAVKNSNIPILLIHGEGDTFVPPEMSEEIYNAGKAQNKNISLVKIPEATHTLSIMFDRETYVKSLSDFIEKNIKEQ